MARKKNYEVSEGRAAQVAATSTGPIRPAPDADDACIDMAALLGPEARFAAAKKTIDLRNWLRVGIDAWVFTAGFCLKAMLLSGSHTTASITTYERHLTYLFDYLTGGGSSCVASRPHSPSDLSPLHIQYFIGWLQMRAQAEAWRPSSTRSAYKSVKAVLLEMFSHGFIPGESSRFFPRGAVTWRGGEGRQTSLSDAEQERLAKAIKSDLVAIHRGRLTVTQSAVQGLRLLLVAHRQGLNLTPLLEMRRDALAPGFLPGTIRIRTAKHRNKKVRSSAGRAALIRQEKRQPNEQPDEQQLFFDLSEGAVLQQAIASTRGLVGEAPIALKQRIWLYRAETTSGAQKKGSATCVNRNSLERTIKGIIKRHDLLGDDDLPLRLNLSRLRKSHFDRALRAADGDMAIAANLMGNTPRVAGMHYAAMNDARKAEAAGFMNDDYTTSMRAKGQPSQRPEIRPVQVHPFKAPKDHALGTLPTPTPVSGCQDSISGEHAPHDGRSHCDRYVMCLFCSSFAIVGTVDELWRLFSFQAFAEAELEYLDEVLGPERTDADPLEDLRERYRVAIPYIDDFTRRQFARTRVTQAQAKTAAGLHPYWQHQMAMSRRARRQILPQETRGAEPQGDTETGDRIGT
jgi:hypothetical protein